MLGNEASFGFCGTIDHCGFSDGQKLIFGRGTMLKVDLCKYHYK